MGVDDRFKTLDYGTDLLWVVTDWDHPVAVGNGLAKLRYRRKDGLFIAQIKVVIGSTTVLPASAGAWFFQLPDDVAYSAIASSKPYTNANDVEPQPMCGAGTAHARQWSSPDVPLGFPIIGAAITEPNRALGGGIGGTEAHGIMRAAMEGAGVNVTNTYPFTWDTYDTLLMSIACEAFSN